MIEMKTINFKFIKESEVPTNNAGSGKIAAIGVGPSGEPPKKVIKVPLFKRKFSDLRNVGKSTNI